MSGIAPPARKKQQPATHSALDTIVDTGKKPRRPEVLAAQAHQAHCTGDEHCGAPELHEKAAPALHDAPGSTQAAQAAPAEPQALLAHPGGPDRGSIPVHPGTAQEPGPIPKAPGGVWPFGLSRLTAMAEAHDRAGLEAFQAMRLPPKVGHYKAELLAWLDRVEAYEKRRAR